MNNNCQEFSTAIIAFIGVIVGALISGSFLLLAEEKSFDSIKYKVKHDIINKENERLKERIVAYNEELNEILLLLSSERFDNFEAEESIKKAVNIGFGIMICCPESIYISTVKVNDSVMSLGISIKNKKTRDREFYNLMDKSAKMQAKWFQEVREEFQRNASYEGGSNG